MLSSGRSESKLTLISKCHFLVTKFTGTLNSTSVPGMIVSVDTTSGDGYPTGMEASSPTDDLDCVGDFAEEFLDESFGFGRCPGSVSVVAAGARSDSVGMDALTKG